jgi:hypothetical protein
MTRRSQSIVKAAAARQDDSSRAQPGDPAPANSGPEVRSSWIPTPWIAQAPLRAVCGLDGGRIGRGPKSRAIAVE